MLGLSRRSVRASWPAYAGAFTALTFGIVLIALTVTLLGAVEATGSRPGVGAAGRAQLEELSSMFGFMSGVSLFMALFVVGSTFGFVVATRRRELGLLRLVGATPGQVRRLLLGEGAVVAGAATVVGCLVATALAPAALWGVRAAGVTDLHLAAPAPWTAWAVAAPCAVVVALTGCWRSSRRASRVPPTAALGEAALERRTPGLAALVTGLIALGAVVAAAVLADRLNPLGALLTAVLLPPLLVTGLTAVGPLVVPRVAGLVALPLVRRSVGARLARDELRTAVRTTSSVAAPVVAISAVAGSLILTLSFSTDWTSGLDRVRLAAPVVVTDAATADRLEADPAVALVDVRCTATVRIGGSPEAVDVVDVAAATSARGLRAVDGSLEELRGRAVAVSESWRFDAGLDLGERVTARVDGEQVPLRVVAVVPDAPDVYGDLLVAPDLVRAGQPDALFVVPRAGVTDAELLAAARGVAGDAALTADDWVDGIAAEARRANNLALLVLLGPSGVYAAIAIVNATLIGAAQRARQRRLLGLLGATPAQLRRTAVWQAVLTTAAGLLLGGATTVFLGWLVRQAVARDLAGHAVDLTVPWLPLLGVGATCIALAVLAALAAVLAQPRSVTR